eukprot:6659754-Prymnesium_polylepis.2
MSVVSAVANRRKFSRSLAGTSSSWPPSMKMTSHTNCCSAADWLLSVRRESPQCTCSRPSNVRLRHDATLSLRVSPPKSQLCTMAFGLDESTASAECPALKPVAQYVLRPAMASRSSSCCVGNWYEAPLDAVSEMHLVCLRQLCLLGAARPATQCPCPSEALVADASPLAKDGKPDSKHGLSPAGGTRGARAARRAARRSERLSSTVLRRQ